MRLLTRLGLLIFLLCCASPVSAADNACQELGGGQFSTEGRLGNNRDIAEVSITAPIKCTTDKVLFTDLRYKGDSDSNREANVGVGVRALRENDVVGGYVYFDRKRSGRSDIYHLQATVGADWQREDRDARVNVYMPLSGAKEVVGTNATSDPFLSGTGIFVQNRATRYIREEPLYGTDVEGGFKIPQADMWVHGAVFAFDSDDAPMIRGGRARATYNINENVALTGEAQYDNQRGRQGWVGVRYTKHFGNDGHAPEGLKARMAAQPVRDVDIVTSAEVTQRAPDTVEQVLNTQTGTAQRIIYVDNTAAGGGNGALTTPYNTLAAAQAAMQNYDIVYVKAGNGTSSGQNAGMVINRTGARLIGSGVDFVYDSDQFTTGSNASVTSTVIAKATTAPVITNTAGIGVSITAADVEVAGVSVNGATGGGIKATNVSGANIHNVTANSNGTHGIWGDFTAGGTYTFQVSDSISNLNTGGGTGITVNATTGSNVTANLYRNTTNDNTGRGVSGNATGSTLAMNVYDGFANTNSAYGIFVGSGGASTINTTIQGNEANGNKNNIGIYAVSLGTTNMTANILENVVKDNISNGIYFQARDSASITGSVRGNIVSGHGTGIVYQTRNNATSTSTFLDNVLTNNTRGFSIDIQNAASLTTKIQGNTITGGTQAVVVNDNSTGAANADFGGGGQGSTGGNRIFGATTDMTVDADGAVIKAENNWWGVSTGLDAGKTSLLVGSTIDSTPHLTVDLAP